MGVRITPHPAIPPPTADNLIDVCKAIKESLEIGRIDRIGDPLDRWVTVRDLMDSELIVAYDQSTGEAGGVGPNFTYPGSITGPPGSGGPFLKPKDPDIIRPLPGRPTNVRTASLWDSIMVKWDWPTEGGNIDWLGAVIWSSPTETFSQGHFAGFSSTNFFIDYDVGLQAQQTGEEYEFGVRYYWVAWFGKENDDSETNQWTPFTGISNQTDWSPYHYQAGVRGETAQDPEYVLALLQGQITESHIYQSLNDRINLVDYDSNGDRYWTPVQDRILAATQSAESGVYAAIAQYAGTHVTEDEIWGEYNVRIDLNGYVVGFGLSALAHIDQSNVTYGETSAFVVKSDAFAVVFPGLDEVIPFIVGQVGGTPTVGIDGQLVVDGTITANAILANTIGATEINAESVWAGIVSADRIFSSSFATGPSPQTRVEINGVGTEGELFPLWYGWGLTSGNPIEDISEPYFYVDTYGTVKLAGDLFVTGTGRFWLGSNEEGDYRLEIGGYNDNIMFWAGRTLWPNRSIDPADDSWIFYIDKFGSAKFRGTVEAEFVSGEFTQVVPITTNENFYCANDTATDVDNVTQWGDPAGEWILPASPFSDANVDLNPGHLPYFVMHYVAGGSGQDAGAIKVEWASPNGIWQELSRVVFNVSAYGEQKTMAVVAPGRVYGASRFRVYFAGFNNNHPTIFGWTGLIMGIR